MFRTIFVNAQPNFRTILSAKNKGLPCYVFSTKGSRIGKVDFSFIQSITKDSQILLIDVRTQEEIKESGQIPASINIPLDCLCKNLGPSTSCNDFVSKFGRLKPSSTTQLIFTCRSGKRAQESAAKAIEIGFSNVWERLAEANE